MSPHKHRPVKGLTETRCFLGPVAWPENPAAHGNVTEWQTCRCGATRAVNVNGLHVERGPWHNLNKPATRHHAETLHYGD